MVVIDVLRAFTTAAYAFAAGARRIWLVETVEEALAVKAARPGTLAMGENRGRWVEGFDFSNSPVGVAAAAAVTASGLGDPTYVISGWAGQWRGEDDQFTAELIERVRTGAPIRADETAAAVAATTEAERTLSLGAGHVDPRDIELATRVDAFDFAMEARRTTDGLELTPTR